jgi:hypothetical protein
MRLLLPITLLALLSGAATAGDIYCLKKGKDCSDRPAPGAEYIRTQQRRPDAPPPEPAPGAKPAAGSATPGAQAAATANARQAVQKDVDQARTEQCKKDRETYQQSLQARRIYRTNKDGEREYLSDTEADQMRLNARIAMEQSCGSAGP